MQLRLLHPLVPVHVNQPFGVNGAYYRAHGINIDGHNGVDLQAYHGQPVYATHDGTIFYETDNSQGHGAVVITDQAFDYKDGAAHFKTIYWHLVAPGTDPVYPYPLKDGAHVKAGDIVGWADSTGLSSGDHLHFGLKPIVAGKSPASGDAPDVGIGAWVNLEPDNGYLGAINPAPYFYRDFVYDFEKDMVYGESSADVMALQNALKIAGQFPAAQECTGYYGDVTRTAVLAYQVMNGVDSMSALAPLNGGRVGPKTRAALNREFAA